MCNVKVNLIAKVSNHSPGKAYAGQHPCKGKIFKNIQFAFFFLHFLVLVVWGLNTLFKNMPDQENLNNMSAQSMRKSAI